MKELPADIDSTWSEKIMLSIKDFGRPMQLKEIRTNFANGGVIPNSINVYVNQATKTGDICKLKYYGRPSFYAYPYWLERDGKTFKPGYEFDPITKEFKTPTINERS